MMSSTGETNNPQELSITNSPSHAKVCLPKDKGRKSDVWDHFTKIVNDGDGKAKGARCNYCSSSYAWLSENGTSTLRKHISKCPKNFQNKDKKQKLLSMHSISEDGGSTLGVWKFDQDLCREALAKMIIVDELPFKFVKHEGFRYFCSVMQPNFKILSRTTMARDCMALYVSERKKTKDLLVNSNQRICLTTDSWTSVQNLSYMCLTAHFIKD
ncbi:zinc finger BED domain-containing protein DAYSLEEPER-like [Magnolia sinica]|uniref:zinc finger BED domain-containing protein DAYSLEEPER-like n=1 Tax=Magnolia sinica TaxID=86752 RepID=UPI002657E823|nr:zinc finger BED domain-containing protein DAYSLEEPER-like [Magnolia sinica]